VTVGTYKSSNGRIHNIEKCLLTQWWTAGIQHNKVK